VWSRPRKMEIVASPKEKLCITTQEGHHILNKQDISILKASGNYTSISIAGKDLLCAQTLASVLQKINLPQFVRIHKSHVINLEFIRHIDNSFTTITTDDGKQLAISRSRKQEIKQLILNRFD